jgi:hypothetical protein
MGSPGEFPDAPKMIGNRAVASSKAESIDMDLYIDPVKERKMMLKFDVSSFISLAYFITHSLPVLCHWHVGPILYDGQSRPVCTDLLCCIGDFTIFSLFGCDFSVPLKT